MRSIGFGLERLGLIAVARPGATLAVVLVCIVLAAIGASKTRFADDMASIFRSDSVAYSIYEDFRHRFVDGSDAAILLIEGDFQTPGHWAALQNLEQEVNDLQAVSDVVSILSLHDLNQAAGSPSEDAFDSALFDEDFEDPEAVEVVEDPIDAVAPLPDGLEADPEVLVGHPLNGGRLLSDDFSTATMVMAFTSGADRLTQARAVEQGLEPILAKLPKDMSAQVSGLPIVRAEIVRHLVDEHPLLLAGGLIIGFSLGVLLLGVLVDAVIVAIMPILSILFVYGAFGWLGIPMTVLLNDLPLLVLALSFAANMHLVYAARRDLFAADYDFQAITKTVSHVGPACALASLTTVIAFLSFYFSGSEAIVEFGIIGAVSVIGVFVVAMVSFPLTVWVALKLGWRPCPALRGNGRIAQRIEGVAVWASGVLDKNRIPITAVAVLIAIAAGVSYTRIVPSYTYLEEIPKRSTTYDVMQRLETELGGAHTIHLPLPIELDPDNPDLTNVLTLRDAHKAAEAALPGRRVYSAWTIVQWLTDTDRTASAPRLEAVFDAAPAGLRGLLLSEDGTTPALVVNVADEGNMALSAMAAKVEQAVGAALETDVSGKSTGIVVLASRVSSDIIGRLGFSLLVAAIGTSILVGIGFRSPLVAIITLIPNILPVLAVGGMLYLLDKPLQIASALAMTIALGIAVDDTVHMINGYWAHRCVRSPRAALARTMRDVGPVLVMTSLVLMLGLSPALLSWSPGIGTFAAFAIVTIGIALVTCVIALPALLALWARRIHATPKVSR